MGGEREGPSDVSDSLFCQILIKTGKMCELFIMYRGVLLNTVLVGENFHFDQVLRKTENSPNSTVCFKGRYFQTDYDNTYSGCLCIALSVTGTTEHAYVILTPHNLLQCMAEMNTKIIFT